MNQQQKTSSVTPAQASNAFKQSSWQRMKGGLGIIVIGTAFWLFFNALPGQSFGQKQDRKAKAQSEQPAAQEQLNPNERRIPSQPVDVIADSAAIRQMNARYREREAAMGNPNPAPLHMECKAEAFPITATMQNSLSTGAPSAKIYLVGPAKMNEYEAKGAQTPGLFKRFGAVRTYFDGQYLYVATVK